MEYNDKTYSWQSPSGRFTPIRYSHGSDAYEFTGVVNDPIMAAWKKGYMRVTNIGNELFVHNEVMPPNDKQVAKLIDLAKESGKDYLKYDYGDDYKVLWSVHDILEESEYIKYFEYLLTS